MSASGRLRSRAAKLQIGAVALPVLSLVCGTTLYVARVVPFHGRPLVGLLVAATLALVATAICLCLSLVARDILGELTEIQLRARWRIDHTHEVFRLTERALPDSASGWTDDVAESDHVIRDLISVQLHLPNAIPSADGVREVATLLSRLADVTARDVGEQTRDETDAALTELRADLARWRERTPALGAADADRQAFEAQLLRVEKIWGLTVAAKDGIDLELVEHDERHAIDIETMRALQADARRYNAAGRFLLGTAVVFGIALLITSHFLTKSYVHELKNAGGQPTLMLILLLVRGTLFGGLAVGFVYGILSVANAYIDQATRFRKRLYSAHMLNYAFAKFADVIVKHKNVALKDVMELFSAWNANVDSAFTQIRFQKDSKNLVIGSKDGKLAVEDPQDSGAVASGRQAPSVVQNFGLRAADEQPVAKDDAPTPVA